MLELAPNLNSPVCLALSVEILANQSVGASTLSFSLVVDFGACWRALARAASLLPFIELEFGFDLIIPLLSRLKPSLKV